MAKVAVITSILVLLLIARVWLSEALFDGTPPPTVSAPAGNILPETTDLDFWTTDSFDANAWGYVRRRGNALVAKCMAADGVDYHFEIYQSGCPVVEGHRYTLQFSARADRSLPIAVLATLDSGDWRYVGLDQHFKLDTRWRVYRCSFVAHDTEKAHVMAPRFALGYEPGTVWLADVFLVDEAAKS